MAIMAPPLRSTHKTTAYVMAGIAVFMLLLSFASVPLYRIFCQQTGFGGTPKIVGVLRSQPLERKIRVQFNADVHRGLPWTFKPLQHEMMVRVGEPALAFYKVKNLSDQPLIGIASYNVTPDKVAVYFSKVKCFCFEEQRIEAGQEVEMAVQFYIDPDIENDKEVKDVTFLTLSYMFFEHKDFGKFQKKSSLLHP